MPAYLLKEVILVRSAQMRSPILVHCAPFFLGSVPTIVANTSYLCRPIDKLATSAAPNPRNLAGAPLPGFKSLPPELQSLVTAMTAAEASARPDVASVQQQLLNIQHSQLCAGAAPAFIAPMDGLGIPTMPPLVLPRASSSASTGPSTPPVKKTSSPRVGVATPRLQMPPVKSLSLTAAEAATGLPQIAAEPGSARELTVYRQASLPVTMATAGTGKAPPRPAPARKAPAPPARKPSPGLNGTATPRTARASSKKTPRARVCLRSALNLPPQDRSFVQRHGAAAAVSVPRPVLPVLARGVLRAVCCVLCAVCCAVRASTSPAASPACRDYCIVELPEPARRHLEALVGHRMSSELSGVPSRGSQDDFATTAATVKLNVSLAYFFSWRL